MKKVFVKRILAVLTLSMFCTLSSGEVAQASSQKFYNGHRYKVYDDAMKWSEAKTACEDKGGHLVTITSAKEQKFVAKIISKQKMENYWIGLYKQNGEKCWVTGEEFSYQNIEVENYNQYFFGMYRADNEERAKEAAAGKWYDHDDRLRGDLWDYTLTGYVCEWDTTPMSYADISLKSKTFVYDGTAKKPKVAVKVGNTVLKKNRDYTIKYINNTEVGTAKVKITGKGCYKGTITKKFKIVAK